MRKQSWWRAALMGLLIGAGGVAPGISGGAIAVSLGLYGELCHAAAHPFQTLKTQAGRYIPLTAGALLGVVGGGRLLSFLFATCAVPARLIVVGLLAGTLPQVFRAAAREGVRVWYFLLAALTFFGGTWLFFGGALPKISPTPTALQYLLCGAVLAIGTVLPGVSSSFILMAMNAYESTLAVIGGTAPEGGLPLLLGFVGAAVLCVRAVEWLYRKAYGAVSFLVLGFLLSSFLPAVPPLVCTVETAFSLLFAFAAALCSYALMSKTEE